MKALMLKDMKRGWFVGAFEPTALRTDLCEAAVKHFQAGDKEAAHFHKIATEVSVVISGEVKMFNKVWKPGDIVIAEPGDVTSFEALTDAVLSVVKLPGVLNDKYLAEEPDD